MSAIPSTIEALRSTPTKGQSAKLEVVSIPFGSREDISNLHPDAVVAKTLAVALNPTDTAALSFPCTLSYDHPTIVGCDSSGIVIAVGSNVKHIRVGDRVASFVFGTYNETDGAFAEAVKSNRKNTWALPDGMSNEEGAAFTLAHSTAVQALYSTVKLSGRPSAPSTSGETLLIWGGATSVGHHAVQLAALSGLRVFATASPSNHELLRSLGATECFDYRDPEVLSKIKTATKDGKGVNYAYDTIAKEATVAACIDAIAPEGGHVVTTLRISEANQTRRPEVRATFHLAYETLEKDFMYYGVHHPKNDDSEMTLDWILHELPALLEGWDSKNGGSKMFKGQKLRLEKGGLGGVEAGLKILESGDYKAEKLVYRLT